MGTSLGRPTAMPITAEYEWDESEDVIVLLVPLRGAKAASENVFISDQYIKVNSPPYFLEIDLARSIVAANSRAIFSREGLRLHLHKEEKGLWGENLVSDLPKEERVARRNASVNARYDNLRGEKA